MSGSKSPFDAAPGKLRSVMTALFVIMFSLGVAHAMPVQLIYALGVLSAWFLIRLFIERKRR